MLTAKEPERRVTVDFGQKPFDGYFLNGPSRREPRREVPGTRTRGRQRVGREYYLSVQKCKKPFLEPNDFDLPLHRLKFGIAGVYFRLFSLRQRGCKTIRQGHLFGHFKLTRKLRQFLPRRNYLKGQAQEPSSYFLPFRETDFSFHDIAHFGPIWRRNQKIGIGVRCLFQRCQNLVVAPLRE